MPNLIKKLLYLLEIGNHQFDSILWKTRPEKRKTLVDDIFRFKIPIGKSKKEIREIFGHEPYIYTSMTWSYPVESDKFGNTLTSLSLYFKDEIVTNIRLKIRE
ncbi:hypothetical protein NAL32_20830 [Chryseobacterium sp. Ch-15]|uniref:Uncharacterized protein n=1 Tax=Chryseobacterium muglaense TaxID=2893752 RepID=A0A9Q3YQW8_9FLAO|nr:hypothetical protein [Chryseobacterium muglaense]MBD3907208.1 hypothetical protein [Chryseobacterium muglaense]MCC9033518.1 hypothetical protein [Chryseobacterium muglaense]MCM2556837.1 hypothetical protein [Chryseobacterium muglaense]